ncbi:MAG: hypothetical protein GQ552_01405 [Flavobacteriaceae bacterium]|nr:hypothetical protein [Flavobacteriaceae bacterium]
MKYLFSLLFAGITLITFAQNKENHRLKNMQDFTPEQNAILQTKKMALALDLNTTQQNQILAINKKQAVERKKKMELRKTSKENGTKLSSDERFTMMNSMLDAQLVHQKEMKKILKDDQYVAWKKMQKNKMMKMHKKGMSQKGKTSKGQGKNKMMKKEK